MSGDTKYNYPYYNSLREYVDTKLGWSIAETPAETVENWIYGYNTYIEEQLNNHSIYLDNHTANESNPHNVTASQIGAATAAELANTKTVFNNKVIDNAYAHRDMYESFFACIHYPEESFLMEKYLGGTFKIIWTAVNYTSYTTSESSYYEIHLPFKVKSHNITIDNYSDYCHTLDVGKFEDNYGFGFDIGADAPEEGAESNLLDFTITITGTWE